MSESKITKTKLTSPQFMQSDGEISLSFHIPYSDLHIDRSKLLGVGSYGHVYQGTWKFNTVAIKEFLTPTLPEEDKQKIFKEATAMARVSTHSDNLIRLRGTCLEDPHYCLVMDYMSGGDLFKFLSNKKDNPDIPWEMRYNIAFDISVGLYHLHDKGILHRDLKSPNVLLDNNGRAKLADFGFAKLKDLTSSKSSKTGTPRWTAPELLDPDRSDNKPSQASDVYSLGMIFWELASRLLPYHAASSNHAATAWIMKGKKEDIPDTTPSEFKTLITECWQEPTERPKTETLPGRLDGLLQAERAKKQDKHKKETVSEPASSPTEIKPEEKKFPHPADGKKLGDGSPVQPVGQTTPLNNRIAVQVVDNLWSIPSTADLYRQKNPTPSTDEKKHQQLMPLQNELIQACENGSLAKVKAAIAKGALVDLPNEQGKNPLYCAVYGMNPEVVQYLIARRSEDAPVTSWQNCEEHNKKQYGQTFLNLKFNFRSWKDWYDLLLKIESNEFLVSDHVRKSWGGSLESLKDIVQRGMKGRIGRSGGTPDYAGAADTESGYEGYRNQIKQSVEALQAAQKRGKTITSPSFNYSSTPSIHASQPAFFSGSSSSSSTSSSEAKTKVPPLDEKKRQQLMPLQNELIKACENGSLTKVKAAIAKGALVDVPNEQGKNPLYCAVYGMNPDIVQYLIARRNEDAPVTNWSACEEHNKKHYRQTFLIMKFAPVYYKDWYELLLKIEPNEFLAGYHLAACQKVWGVDDEDCKSFIAVKRMCARVCKKVGEEPRSGWGFREFGDTESGYEEYRNQIKQAMEGLLVAQTNQSMSLNRGTN